jgi:hypothetical protein
VAEWPTHGLNSRRLPKPYRSWLRLQSKKCIKLDSLPARNEHALRHTPSLAISEARRLAQSRDKPPSRRKVSTGPRNKKLAISMAKVQAHLVTARPLAIIGDVDARCALAFLRMERSVGANQAEQSRTDPSL